MRKIVLLSLASLALAACDDGSGPGSDSFRKDYSKARSALEALGRVLRDDLRGYDTVGWWRDAGVAVSLPDTAPEEAAAVLFRLKLRTTNQNLNNLSQHNLQLRLHTKLTTFPNDNPSPPKLIQQTRIRINQKKNTPN